MSLTQIQGNSVTQMIFHVRFMLFEFQAIKHNIAFDYKTKTMHYLIIIEISITNNSDCKFTLCSLATCRNIMYEIEGFLHMPASHHLGFSLRNLEKSWVERESPPKWIPAVPEHWERKTNRSASLTAVTWFSLCSRKTWTIS